MKRIYVTFGNLVVQYEIKGLATQFVETERIQVKKTVMRIAKVTDGFFTVNEFLVSFRWRDFSINSDLPYVKLGERPLICSSFCVKKGAYSTECNVLVMDTAGKELLEYSCPWSKPSGASFNSDENIIVCLNYE